MGLFMFYYAPRYSYDSLQFLLAISVVSLLLLWVIKKLFVLNLKKSICIFLVIFVVYLFGYKYSYQFFYYAYSNFMGYPTSID